MSDFVHGLALKIWHPTLSASDIEAAVGSKAEISHSVGEARVDRPPRKETYCLFSIFAKTKADPVDTMEYAGFYLKKLHVNLPTFHGSRGQSLVSFEVFDPSFSSLYLPADAVMKLAAWKAGVVVVEMRGVSSAK